MLGSIQASTQDKIEVRGIISDNYDHKIVKGVKLELLGVQVATPDAFSGEFSFSAIPKEEYILTIHAPDYISKRIPFMVTDQAVNLGTIFLERDIAYEKSDNLITLTDSDLLEDEMSSITSGMLQASKDVFLNRAAFDFGQAFFRVRGYGSENGLVLINGIPMNKMINGRPQWNNWGGLNDVTRNQEFTHGLQLSDHSFGGILGVTNINTRPSGFRKGIRISSSASNRTYAGRLMATLSSGRGQNGLSYSISASRRWAEEGYIQGTLYDAYSLFGAVEYAVDTKHSFLLTTLMTPNRRGRSSAITEEVFNVMGKTYNPYWGKQNGEIRNARERKVAEPILMLNHFYSSHKLDVTTGISYQFGTDARSRMGYYNAPNPDPTYYRYLPSFYINSPIGANFVSANMAKDGFLDNPQLNWNRLYQANSTASMEGKAAYLLYDDTSEDSQLSVNSVGNYRISPWIKLDFGGTYRNLESDNYAQIKDLLGSVFHEDIDPFSNTENDVEGSLKKGDGDKFNYAYKMKSNIWDLFSQFSVTKSRWEGFVAANYSTTSYQREGLFRNQRFYDNSLGEGSKVEFFNFGTKGGFTYKFNGRHRVALEGAYIMKAPVYQNVFINPRENNEVVPDLQSEKITTVAINYYLRMPKLTGRVTGFYTRFQNTTDINFFFVDAGVGSDFVQEVVSDLDKLHMGTELGLEYQVSSSVKLSGVAAVGKYSYASDPFVTINFDTAGAEEDMINSLGTSILGVSKIKGQKLSQGPQLAYALGVEYRDPKYWWIGATTNYLGNNYAGISTITRTASFYIDPETGNPFPNATEENVQQLLQQHELDDMYLLNMVGGKSWLKGGKYISAFVSVNNIFDAVYRTGGYEQSRNGNFGQLQQDNLSGSPSFAPKYWYSYGRTYFINLAVSF
ncbi:TonB-dependent receptor [Arenibacter sp. H213]|uniref:TonB-dependent receptor n=1 Tax=Arenibacter antarcticus TaxID=2040469 RepID=A0ABW5VGX2_9FLAO|nr:TonB-dependent receptor [Arenibacter sp. H213]MCM4166725.1 TonB-dependent receptor [Arenibacter sp. H213]